MNTIENNIKRFEEYILFTLYIFFNIYINFTNCIFTKKTGF